MLPNANSPVCLLPMSCQHSRDIFRENMYRISTASQNCTMSPCSSCRISHGHRIVGRHVCPYFRRLHVAVEPFCPSYQDQRSVGPDPLQYVQCHFHQRVAGNRIQFGTGIEGHKGKLPTTFSRQVTPTSWEGCRAKKAIRRTMPCGYSCCAWS